MLSAGCEWLRSLHLGLVDEPYESGISLEFHPVEVVAREVPILGLCGPSIFANEPDLCFIIGDVIGVLVCESPE